MIILKYEKQLRFIYGENVIEDLKKSKVLIAGPCGVRSCTSKVIAKSFIDNIVLIDFDIYDITNLNSQLHSLIDKLGMSKHEIFANL